MSSIEVLNERNGAARCVLEVRRMIQQSIAEDIIQNPAIDLLLALFLAPDDGWLGTAELCEGSSASEDGCRRWGAVLAERGLVIADAGRYRLSDRGRAVMDGINDAVWSLAERHLGRQHAYAV